MRNQNEITYISTKKGHIFKKNTHFNKLYDIQKTSHARAI